MSAPSERVSRPDGPLGAGDPILLVDRKDRRYFVVLAEAGRTDIRGHVFMHDDLIGRLAGFRMRSSRDETFIVLRPTLAEMVVDMPRFATIIYPKDLGTILVWGDLKPGLRVVEAGIGTGALAIAVLRAIGQTGELFSYEIRHEAENRARKNIRLAFGGADPENHQVHRKDIYEGIEEREVDRILLDVPEPWQVVPHALTALRDGGVFMAYSPTVLQVKETVDALHQSRAFALIETSETMMRDWHVAPNSIRPELRMVGHSGFLTFARKVRRGPEMDAAPAPDDPEADGEVAEADAGPEDGA
jgi:tRNA (adenine57-N1/adenine58-N1)-methyltransferase catalytic subunit